MSAKTKTQEFISEWINNNEEKWNRMTEAEKALKKENLSLVYLKDKPITEQLKEGFAENNRIIRKAEIDRAKVRMCNLIVNDQFVLALDIMKEHIFQMDLAKERGNYAKFIDVAKKEYPILRKECLEMADDNLEAISKLTRMCVVLQQPEAFDQEEVNSITKTQIDAYSSLKDLTGAFITKTLGIQIKSNSLDPLDWQYMANQYTQLTALIDLVNKLFDNKGKNKIFKS